MKILVAALLLSLSLWGQTMPQQKAGARVEVKQAGAWVRGTVSSDDGPASSTVKVRLDSNSAVLAVLRSSVRIAPMPIGVQAGDHLEAYDSGTNRWVPATVKRVRDGEYAFLMVPDSNPKSSGTWTRLADLCILPENAPTAAPGSLSVAPPKGMFNCYADRGGSAMELADVINFSAGTYTTQRGGSVKGSYVLLNGKIEFTSGPMAGTTATLDGSQLRLMSANSSGKSSDLVCSSQ
jgi:hypothetical protein